MSGVCIFCRMALIYVRPQCVNSSSPSAAYMRHWTGSALVQIMACRLIGAKPLSESMLEYCQSKYNIFRSWKCISKCHLGNGGHFVQGRWVKGYPVFPCMIWLFTRQFPGTDLLILEQIWHCTEITTWTFVISEMTLAYFTKKVKLES